jgi:hypothetical protein
MDLQSATLSMAVLMKREYDFYNEHTEEIKSLDVDTLREFEWVKSETREFGNQLAANPNFFGVMESWKVYISGKEGVNRDSILKAHKEDNVEDLFEKCGSMAVSIKNYLQDKKHMICDMSAGEDGWDVAIRCTEGQSKVLCQEVYRRYSIALEMVIITVSRRFAGHCLPGLYSWDDAIKILKISGM